MREKITRQDAVLTMVSALCNSAAVYHVKVTGSLVAEAMEVYATLYPAGSLPIGVDMDLHQLIEEGRVRKHIHETGGFVYEVVA